MTGFDSLSKQTKKTVFVTIFSHHQPIAVFITIAFLSNVFLL